MAEAHYKTNSIYLILLLNDLNPLVLIDAMPPGHQIFPDLILLASFITGIFECQHSLNIFIKEGTSLRRTGISEKELRDSHDRKTVLQENELKVLRRVDKDPFLSKVGMSWVCKIKGKINSKHCLLVNESFPGHLPSPCYTFYMYVGNGLLDNDRR